jgi:hypothetical protein
MIDIAETGVGRVQERAQAFLDEQPAMLPFSLFYWRAFQELGTERPMGFEGKGPIPLSAIRNYAVDLSMDDDEYEMLKRIIMSVDSRREILIRKYRKNSTDKPHDK